MKYIIGYLAVFFTFFACSNDSISVNEVPIVYLANLHTSFLCNLIYPTFITLSVYIN